MPGKSKYTAVPCPPPGQQTCAAIDEWARHWHAWGLKVHAEVFGEGEPEDVDPPPPPPFGG